MKQTSFPPGKAHLQPAHAVGKVNDLKGTWVGTYRGFNDSGHVAGQEKIVITKVKGSIAVGTWQSRSSAKDKWSKPETVRFAAYGTGSMGYELSGGDSEGTYVGTYSAAAQKMTFAYTAQSLDLLVITIEVTKKR